MFSAHVVIHIRSEMAIQLSELSDIIEEAVTNHRLGSVTVKRDSFYGLVAIQGKCSARARNSARLARENSLQSKPECQLLYP